VLDIGSGMTKAGFAGDDGIVFIFQRIKLKLLFSTKSDFPNQGRKAKTCGRKCLFIIYYLFIIIIVFEAKSIYTGHGWHGTKR
jgi:hypothetical protein